MNDMGTTEKKQEVIPVAEYAINRDFIEKLLLAMNHATRPFDIHFGKKMRVVVDYDPQEPQIKFKYFAEVEHRQTE